MGKRMRRLLGFALLLTGCGSGAPSSDRLSADAAQPNPDLVAPLDFAAIDSTLPPDLADGGIPPADLSQGGLPDLTATPDLTTTPDLASAPSDLAHNNTFCNSNTDCAPDQYCQFPMLTCAAPGMCTRRPQICPLFCLQQCGCDGKNYCNACLAAGQGVNIAHMGRCM